MKSQKTNKSLGTNKQSQNNDTTSSITSSIRARELELTAELKALRIQSAHARREVFRTTQQDALNRGLMEQKNAICAIMLIDQHYNMKKRNKRDEPPGTQVSFIITRNPLSEDHCPEYECRASIAIRGYDGERWESDIHSGSTKNHAKEAAATHLLAMLQEELDFAMPNGGWIRDLAVEGVEPNPGPIIQNRGRTFRGSVSNTFPLESTLAQDFNTIYISTGVGNAGHSISVTIIKGSGGHVLNVGPDKTIGPVIFPGGESVTVSVEQEPPNAGLQWRIHQFYGPQRSDPVVIGQTVSTIVTNSVDARIVNQPIQATITSNLPLDVNVINTSIPISIDSGDGFEVTVTNSGPIWVTDTRPTKNEDHTDILTCGDVEANPGPGLDDINLSLHVVEDPYKGKKPHVNLPEFLGGDPFPKGNLFELHDLVDPPKWTEQQRNDYFAGKAKMNGIIGSYFRVVSHCYGVPTSNRFAELASDVIEDALEYHRVGNRPAREKAAQPAAKTAHATPEVTPKKPEKKVSSISDEEKMRNVLTRIVTKFTKDIESFIGWIDSDEVKRPFKAMVCKRLFGEGWESRSSFNVYEAYAYCHIRCVPSDVRNSFIVALDTSKEHYISENFRAGLQAAELHNKLMHAFNGNIFTRKMKDVDAAPTWRKLLGMPLRKLSLYTGIENQIRITNIRGDVNPQLSNLFHQDRIRANFLVDTPNVRKNMVMPLPTTNLIPRDHWVEGDEDIYNYNTGSVINRVNIAEYYSYPIKATEFSLNLSIAAYKQQTTTWRRDNTLACGFNMFDVLGQNSTLLQKGFSAEQAALKWEMLHSVLLLKSGSTAIQATSFNVINPSFNPNTTPPILRINTGRSVGERCGGVEAPVFPFGGDTGEIAFHLTEATVPSDRLSNVIYCPPGLLQGGEDGAEAIPYLVAGFSDWPWCMWHVFKEGTFSPFGPAGPSFNTKTGEDAARFVPVESYTNIPGRKQLDVILPKKVAEANPTTPGQALSQARIAPRFGPTASGGNNANAPIPINHVGGDYVTVPLTQFMVSWSNTMDVTSLKQFLGRVGLLIGIEKALTAAKEMRIALCQQAPSLYVGDDTGVPIAPVFPVDASSQDRIPYMHKLVMSNHTRAVVTPPRSDDANSYWPCVTDTPVSMRVFETNLAVWNKVVLGLATAENIESEALHKLPPHIGDPRTPFWDRIEAIPMFTSWAIYYALTGLTTKGWDQGYTLSTNKWIQQKVKRTFCTEHNTGTMVPAPNGAIVRKIMECTTNRSPAVMYSSVGENIIEISHYDRWTPRTDFAKVLGNDKNNVYTLPREYDCYVPTVLPDIILSLFCDSLPKCLMTFPPAWGVDGTQGYSVVQNPKLNIHRAINNTIVGSWISEAKPYYMITEGPNPDDDSKWNTRLWFTQPRWQAGDYSGGPIAELFPYDTDPAVPNPSLRPVTRGTYVLPNELTTTSLAGMNTYCIPDMAESGQRVFLYVPSDDLLPVQACTRQSRLLRSVWLLGDVHVEPQIQFIASSDEIKDALEEIITEKESGAFLEVAPPNNVVVSPSELAAQGGDVGSLPNLANQSSDMNQPSEKTD